jgi:hypothetical protein
VRADPFEGVSAPIGGRRLNTNCILCGRGDAEVPIVTFAYRGARHAVCSQHLPVLIHDPASLAGVLPGAEGLAPADHDD